MNLSNISVGVDIEDNYRFKGLDRNSPLLKKIFLNSELNYCFSKKEPTQSLAARFAAKEATIKALSVFEIKPPFFNEIEIKKNKQNLPYIELEGYESRLSLSHCGDKSVAFIIISKVKI